MAGTASREFVKMQIDFLPDAGLDEVLMAINAVKHKFVPHIPNAETIAAMEEAERISSDPNTKRYSNFAELLEDVLSEEDDDE
ncbi:MAG: hypothetical protein FWG90_09160 [Oscillospiraceae bacterium]|nr:hypothetical protein [Oscillospiraceae bacterium]